MVAVCRGSAKADALRKLGADAVVDTAEAGKDVPLRQLIKAWPYCICVSYSRGRAQGLKCMTLWAGWHG